MKKLFLIGVGIVLAVAIFGMAGFAYAQTLELSAVQVQEPPEPLITDGPEFPYGRASWCRSSRGVRMCAVPDGLMGFGLGEDESGLLHDYLWTAIAESFGLTSEQIEAFEIVQETIKGIREELTQEELRNTMKQAMTVAIESALVDGAITEEQAEVRLERLEQMEVVPFGSGKEGNFRQGFSRGVKFGRQMMANHEYLDAAIAKMLGVSVEDFQEMKTEQGFNLKVYADENGLSGDELNALRMEIFTDAVNLALEDGAIKQEQANWVLDHLENIAGRGGWFDQP